MKKFKLLAIILLSFSYNLILDGQEYVMPLYKGPVPNSINTGQSEKIERNGIVAISNVQIPDISVYLPGKRFATGQAVIICPGGGYHILCYDYEGTDVARFFNSIGVAAIVLKYRLPVYGNTVEPHEAPLMDAQRAMRLVRFNAAKWNINPQKIGIMGFSAGGHLATTLATHFDYGNKTSADSVERVSCRPDFMIPVYPVVSFVDPSVHIGSRESLLGKDAGEDLAKYYSNELHVTDDTPPAFFIHADDDQVVPVENTLLMYKALRAKNIPAEIHIVSEGTHGFGLSPDNDHIGAWTINLKYWLKWLNERKPGKLD